MTELTFLIDLLLNHDLPKETKASIASRIKEVELTLQPMRSSYTPAAIVPTIQPPSHMIQEEVPMMAQTAAAAIALAQRAESMSQAQNHRRPADPRTGRPRKF